MTPELEKLREHIIWTYADNEEAREYLSGELYKYTQAYLTEAMKAIVPKDLFYKDDVHYYDNILANLEKWKLGEM